VLEATITSKGQITLPKALLSEMQLKTGDKILFFKQENKTYLIKPLRTDMRSLKGCIAYQGEPKTLEDTNTAIEKM